MDGKLAGALDDGKMIIYSVSRAFEIVHQPVRHASPRTVRGPTDRVEGKAILSLQASGNPEPSRLNPSQLNFRKPSASAGVLSLAPWREWPSASNKRVKV